MKANESLNIVKNIDSKFIVQLTQIAYLYYSVKGFNVALIYLKAIKLILSILFDGCESCLFPIHGKTSYPTFSGRRVWHISLRGKFR